MGYKKTEFVINDTVLPFGIEEIKDQLYLKCLILENKSEHILIKNEIEKIENDEKVTVSNLRKLKENNFIIKLRVKKYKDRHIYNVNYLSDNNYLKTVDNITSNDKMNITFTVGKKYNITYNEKNIISLPLYLKTVSFL